MPSSLPRKSEERGRHLHGKNRGSVFHKGDIPLNEKSQCEPASWTSAAYSPFTLQTPCKAAGSSSGFSMPKPHAPAWWILSYSNMVGEKEKQWTNQEKMQPKMASNSSRTKVLSRQGQWFS